MAENVGYQLLSLRRTLQKLASLPSGAVAFTRPAKQTIGISAHEYVDAA